MKKKGLVVALTVSMIACQGWDTEFSGYKQNYRDNSYIK